MVSCSKAKQVIRSGFYLGNCRTKNSHARRTEGSGYNPSVSREVFSDENNANFLAFGGPKAEDAYVRLTNAFGWLSEVEVMMVARFVPRLQITYKLNGQTGCKGHVVTFYNNTFRATSRLPRPPGQLPVVLLVLTGKNSFLNDRRLAVFVSRKLLYQTTL